MTLGLGLGSASSAAADSLTIASGSDPVAGLPSGVDYLYDTGGMPLNLTVIARPASGPACQPTSVMDAQLAGGDGTAYITPTPLPLRGAGGDRVPYTYPAPGSYRVCAWMARSPDDVVSASSFQVDARKANASAALQASQVAPKAGGSDVLLHLTGATESTADLLALVMPGGQACPATYDEEAAQTVFDVTPSGTPTRVTGPFDVSLQSRDLLSYRRWRLCAYVQDGLGAAGASTTASTLIDLLVKPQLMRRPRVKRQGAALRCDGGLWKARPKAKLGFTWVAGGAQVGTGQTLPAAKSRGRAVACKVTARNSQGRTSATSKPVKAS
jgi:hypothetical protein